MIVGCPRITNTHLSRANALQCWWAGKNPSIKKNIDNVMKTTNKEDRNKFIIVLSSWSWRFTAHLFITPHHILQKPGKKDCMIYDAAFQHTTDSVPINMMTKDTSKTELYCNVRRVKQRLYIRIYNFRITYLMLDIIIHINDGKICFRLLKHHLDCMGAYSYITSDLCSCSVVSQLA